MTRYRSPSLDLFLSSHTYTVYQLARTSTRSHAQELAQDTSPPQSFTRPFFPRQHPLVLVTPIGIMLSNRQRRKNFGFSMGADETVSSNCFDVAAALLCRVTPSPDRRLHARPTGQAAVRLGSHGLASTNLASYLARSCLYERLCLKVLVLLVSEHKKAMLVGGNRLLVPG